MTKHWEAEFWGLLSPGTILRLKAELGIGSTDANSAPPAGNCTPDQTGGALPLGTRVQMHTHNNTLVFRGYVIKPNGATPADSRRIEWDDAIISTHPVSRLEAV